MTNNATYKCKNFLIAFYRLEGSFEQCLNFRPVYSLIHNETFLQWQSMGEKESKKWMRPRKKRINIHIQRDIEKDMN